MSSPNPPIASLDDAERVWDILTERIEAFVVRWDAGGAPPTVAEFAPVEPPAVRRMGLIELVKVDLEYRWQQGGPTPPRIEAYLAEFPELADEQGVPCDLIYEEFHVRKGCGDNVTLEEYFGRFPKQAEELARLLGTESPLVTTSLFRSLPAEEVAVGEQLDDFDLLVQLGKGAFATVFLARQRSLQRLVALKVSANQGNEPQTLAQLDHPHIVRVYDQRIVAERGLRLLYMQYVAGGTLQDVIAAVRRVPPSERSGQTLLAAIDRALDQRGESPPEDSAARTRLKNASWPDVVCWLGGQLAAALHYAHRRGVLHRDLKPANILLTSEANARLVDFNISFCSKLEGASPAAYFGGSLAYMSPEQLEACNPRHPRKPESLDGRSDVYSLGVVLWELLMGGRPFLDEQMAGGWSSTLAQMVERRRSSLPPSPGPPALRDVLMRCLAPDAAGRFANAGELADQLRLCLHPEAQRLLSVPRRGWRALLQRHLLLAILLLAVLPNGVSAWFNLVYNRQQIVQHIEDSERVFGRMILAINGIAFPLGIAILIGLAWRLSWAVRGQQTGRPPATPILPALRRRSLRLGHYIAVIGLLEWLVAGIAYPVAMHVGGVAVAASDYAHFVSSMALCGMIAAAYPFFGVTVLLVRVAYPPLARPGSVQASELADLHWLYRAVWIYMALAASVPMLGVMLLVNLTGAPNRLALAVLSAVSLGGFGLIFWLARVIQRDLGTLAHTLHPQAESDPSETESFRLKLG